MYKKSLFFLVIAYWVGCMTLSAQNFGGHPASLKWYQVNTPNARVVFPAGLDSQAKHIHRLIQTLDSSTKNTIGGKAKKWNVVMLNQTMESNAFVRMAPVLSEFYMMPPQNSFSLGSLRWDENLAIHENRHMQQFSNFNKGLTRVFSSLLGQEGQLLANGLTIPDYFFEGDAIWQETLVSQQGRGRLPYFFNGWKSLWQANKKYGWMKIRSGSYRHFLPDHYQTGYLLVAYGYKKFGPGFWQKVTDDAVRFKGLFYPFNRAIEKHTGMSYAAFREAALLDFQQSEMPATATADEVYLTSISKNNVTDYLFPALLGNDSIVVTKQSFKEINSFYLLVNGQEIKLRVKDFVTDDYFSCRNGKIVYAAYVADPRYANRSYSVLQLYNIYTDEHRPLGFKTRYFSPDINENGTQVVAVQVNADGSNFLHLINTADGSLINELPNKENYFYTQSKFVDNNHVVSAVRHPDGRMALVMVNLQTDSVRLLMPFERTILGYPFVKDNKVYYTAADQNSGKVLGNADRIFAIDINTGQRYKLTANANGLYYPVITQSGDLVASSFTADGYRLQQVAAEKLLWEPFSGSGEQALLIGQDLLPALQQQAIGVASHPKSSGILPVERYRKSNGLLNFHSARPIADDPEYGYSLFSDNVLSTFNNSINYLYNRNETSHTLEYNVTYGGLFPFLMAGAAYSHNRYIDTGQGRGILFNSTRFNAGFYLPFSFLQGRTFKYLNFGASFVSEKLPPFQVYKDLFGGSTFNYINVYGSFSNVARQAIQHVNPRWAQAFSFSYRKAYSFFNGYKLVGASSLYFPGFFTNHSIVFNAAWQRRDTFPDFFSNNFPFSRGYLSISGNRMFRYAINYQLPICYPEVGLGNIFFVQRIRLNGFYDYTRSVFRVRGSDREVINRSLGAECFFDTKLWNALPASLGVRYSHLLDTDLRNRAAVSRWEIILPINIIPD